MSKKVRVRFAPSPTGGLHLGGVRTVLFNYLFAKQHNGDFIVRIEDTDQSRFVEGAEKYIFDCLDWCGLIPDESVLHGGPLGPYRQSERKERYRLYADQLIAKGVAYYAFDTAEELEKMREQLKAKGSHSLQYDHHVRMEMKNSLSLPAAEVESLIESGTPYVIRIKINPDEAVEFNDMIRGEITFDTNNVDDKVLLKADGMPTYHLAVVVDDYEMQISHAFRGEEWLPSAPVHILLWKYLFGLEAMPEWAHLPLILKPDGNGKLSKRDGDRLGFPVYAMDWTDPITKDVTKGFKEIGFLPEAFINLLAVLGWNDGTEQEIFELHELVDKFSIDRVHKGGAKFDFEKAKWFNHEWIKKLDVSNYADRVKATLEGKGLTVNDNTYLEIVMNLVKDRCTLLDDFFLQGHYFFSHPTSLDEAAVRPKWDGQKKAFFESLSTRFDELPGWNNSDLESLFKALASEHSIKMGELQMIFRVMLVGSKIGPGVFIIAETIGKDATITRIKNAIGIF